jgi:glycosyltransferase involved in cell wall biosynthesis
MRLKVLIVTPEFLNQNGIKVTGGLATYTDNVFTGLTEMGLEVYVLQTSSINVIDKNPRIFFLKKYAIINKIRFVLDKLTFHRLKRSVQWLLDSFLLNLKIELLDNSYNFDVIHYSSYKAVGFFAFTRKPRIFRISSIQHLWDKYEGRKPSVDRKLSSWLEIKALNKADHLIGPSDLLMRYLKLAYRFKSTYSTTPTPIGIDHNRNFETSHCKNYNKQSYVLYFGTISKLKGVEILAGLIEDLRKLNKQLWLIGKVNSFDEQRSCLDFIFEFDKNKDVIRYLGIMSGVELNTIIKGADLVLIPSMVDNFPNTILESISNGSVVIASDRSGVKSIIKDGHNGFICKYDNIEEYIIKIKSWYTTKPIDRLRIKFNVLETYSHWLSSIKPYDLLINEYHKVIVEHEKD